MYNEVDWMGDETPSQGGFDDFHNGDYDPADADVTKTAIEEQMQAQIFIVDGVLTMLFFPFRVLKLVGADSRKSRSFFFPLGHKLTCVPLLSLLMWTCAIAIGLQIYRDDVDARDLRTLANVKLIVSIGDSIVAITMFAGVALVVASAVSHHPRFVRWSQEISNVLESVPFAQAYHPMAGAAFTQHSQDLVEDLPLLAVAPSTNPQTIAPVPQASVFDSSVNQQHLGSADRISPPAQPLGLTKGPSMKNQIHRKSVQQEFRTMDDPIPRSYIPFTHILMDEVPPLRDDEMYFIYDAAEWFEPQKQNRKQLDRSLAIFRDVWTQQQKAELEDQLQRRRMRAANGTLTARNAETAADADNDINAAHIAVISADSAEWKPSDLFKFTIGDKIVRNDDLLHLEVSFDGNGAVQPGETFIISNRMWHEDCALYCVEGAAETHQWQAIEALFESTEDNCGRKIDKAITIENMLLAMSGRDMLRRYDVYSNGNVSSSEHAVRIQPWATALYILMCSALSIVPEIIRLCQGGGLYAQFSIGNVLGAFAPIFLFALAGSSMFVFLATTRCSVSNYEDAMDSFTEVTMGSANNKWYPVLNWFETTNIRTWFHLRQHIVSAYKVHYNSRMCACLSVLMLASSWSWFVIAYSFTFANRSRPTADGWIFEVSLVCIPLLVELFRIFEDANKINELCIAHRANIAQIQVALDEELMLVGARTINRNPALQTALLNTLNGINGTIGMSETRSQTSSRVSSMAAALKIQGLSHTTIGNRNHEFQFLLDAKALMDDVRFAVEMDAVPLCPFGLPVTHHLVQYVAITLLANLVGVLMVLAGFALNSWRWDV